MSQRAFREWSRGWLLGAAVVSSLVTDSAAAHDPPRVLDAWLDEQGQPDVVLMNRGMLFADGAGSYGFMCNEALGINTAERPHMAHGPGDAISAVTTAGLLQSVDRGCTWTPHPTFVGLALRGFTTSPTDPASWYVATAVNAFDNGIFVSRDSGASWMRHYTNPTNSIFEHLFTAPSDDQRLYASGLRLGDASFIYSVSRSVDGGSSFQTFDFALEPDEFEVRLLGVHPTNPEIVYAVADSQEGAEPLDRFLISSDGGQSFRSPTSVLALDAFAVAPDGNTLWLGGKDALFRSDDAGETFDAVGQASFVSWIDGHSAGLHLGAYFPPQHQGLGLSTDGGDTVALVMDFNEATHPIACGGASMVPTICEQLWTDWVYEQNQRLPRSDAGSDSGSPAIDAGSRQDAGRDAGAKPDEESDSGCTITGAPTDPTSALPMLLVLASVIVRAQRRRLAR